MKKISTIFFLIFATLLLPCSINSSALNLKNITVWSNGFHTGILLENSLQLKKQLTLSSMNSERGYTDFGWGEFDFYTTNKKTFYSYLKAAAWPTKSTVRTEFWSERDYSQIGSNRWSVKIYMSEKKFDKIVSFMKNSISFRKNGSPLELIQSGNVCYHGSPLKYHIFNTCNTWVTRALKKGEIKISPFMILTNDMLLWKILQCGEKMELPN